MSAQKKIIKAQIVVENISILLLATYFLSNMDYVYFSCQIKIKNKNLSKILTFENRYSHIDCVVVNHPMAYEIHRILISPQFAELIKERLPLFEPSPLVYSYVNANRSYFYKEMAVVSDSFFLVRNRRA